MLTVKFYKAEQFVPNGPEGLGIWGWRDCHVNGTSWVEDRNEAIEIMQNAALKNGEYLAMQLLATDESETVQWNHLQDMVEKSAFRVVDKEETFTHASGFGYSDVHAYEIVRIVSDKTIEVRMMDAEFSIAHLEQVVGGFSGHVVNQHNQNVAYAHNPNAKVERIRKNKRGQWTKHNVKFELQTEPYAFHDFNF